jgi:MFS family permease
VKAPAAAAKVLNRALGAVTALVALPYVEEIRDSDAPDAGGDHGAITGIYSMSRGIGMTLGPLLGGVAIQSLGPTFFSTTAGYGAIWVVVSTAIFGSLPPLQRLRAEERDRAELRDGEEDRGQRTPASAKAGG